jgi:hypothetical protein
LDPVQINAGAWYLLPRDWSSEHAYTWAVCEATTGEQVGKVTLDPATGAITTQVRVGHDRAASAAAASVQRFAAVVGPAGSE